MPVIPGFYSPRLRGACSLIAGALLCTVALQVSAQQAAPEAKPSSLPSLHSDIKFSVFAPARLESVTAATPKAALDLKRQIKRVTAGLQAAAQGLYGSKMDGLGAFDVYVADSAEAETLSSATGKIALYAGIAQLAPSDEWLAFVIAREMGHVLAGHHDANSTASIITSVIMNLIIPGSSLLKSVVSLAGSQTAAASGAERQMHEADEIGLRLLEAAGYRLHGLAHALAAGPSAERLGTGSWARAFVQSAATIHARAVATAVPVAVAQTGVQLTSQALPQIEAVLKQSNQSPQSVAGLVPLPLQVAVVPVSLPDLPIIRARPSGVAGPLMLGGYAVPARRFD